MNTQKVEERPKDLSILARDEEKKDTPRSILREEDERESRTREGKAMITTPYFFGLCLFQESHLGLVASPLLTYS